MCSIKAGYNDFDKVCKLDIKELYNKSQKENVPYLQWPKWLTAKISYMYMNEVYKGMLKRKHYRPLVDKAMLRKDAIAAHYFSAFKLDPAYFYAN